MEYTDLLRAAWKSKLNQKIEDVQRELNAIAQTCGLELPVRLGTDAPVSSITPVTLEIAVLQASVHRTLGDLNSASRGLRRIQDASREKMLPITRQFYFELGLLYFVQGDYSSALEEFRFAAQDSAGSLIPRKYPLLNGLLCAENLGLAQDSWMRDLERELASESGEDSVREQFEVFKMRHAFREGRIADAIASVKKSGNFGQREYYAIWLSQLPYHPAYQPLSSAEFETAYSSNRYFHQRSFRLRTLQGILHSDDRNVAKASELVDRLYLWTWRWLSNPGSMTPASIVNLLQWIANRGLLENPASLAIEDRKLLMNSLLWLSIFEPRSRASLDEGIHRLRTAPAGAKADLLDFETSIALSIRARISGESVARASADALAEHPLWDSKRLCHLRSLLDSVSSGRKTAPSLQTLSRRLSGLCSESCSGRSSKIVVDAFSFEVSVKGKKQFSPVMVKALLAFQASAVLTCAQLCETCFGIVRYDPVIHSVKIFNLLARLKTLTRGHLDFKVRQGYAICEGSWKSIEITRQTAEKRFSESPEWGSLLDDLGKARRSKVASALHASARVKTLPEWMGRKDLEFAFGKSRATVNRMLIQWIRSGDLAKKGSARATRYRLSDRLRSELQNGRFAA